MSEEKGVTVKVVDTQPHAGQKPGTSGLRKKVSEFQRANYLENFIQSVFDALPAAELRGSVLVLSGDGRFYNDHAAEIALRMAAANGVGRVLVRQDFLMSTPCVSAVIRKRKAYGGIILTASHNPGGPNQDFGVKYNTSNGGPAPEGLTELIYEKTTKIKQYKIAAEIPKFANQTGEYFFGNMVIEVIDAPQEYADLMKQLFDFPALKRLLARADFTMVYDAMFGVAGPFARRIFCDELGAPEAVLQGATPKPDFNGGHPDPNLTYAHDLVVRMGLGAEERKDVPSFGAASDGDADRNMILGSRFFVTPSDSVAIIAANAQKAIPYFKGGLKGVARSMPTSAALDRVAQKLGMDCYEVPTGWKFFGNLMDAGKLSICGEESFGTGSDHIREKDGLWAILAWLSILEFRNRGSKKLVTVQDIVEEHWKTFGRNYYTRYDYENVDAGAANKVMDHLRGLFGKPGAVKSAEFELKACDDFRYVDPVDRSVSDKQGIRFMFKDGSRFVFRLSGTGSVGATIRLYVEKYEANPNKLLQPTHVALKSLIDLALKVSRLHEFTGRDAPTVIT